MQRLQNNRFGFWLHHDSSKSRRSYRFNENKHLFIAKPLGYGKEGTVYFYPTGKDRILLHSASDTPTLERDAQLVQAVLSPDAKWLATGGWSGRIELWSVPSGEQAACSFTYQGISQFAFSPNGFLIAIAEMWHISHGSPYPIHMCCLPDLQPFAYLRGHDHHIFGLAFAPDNSWLVSTGLDRTVRLWNVQKGVCEQIRQQAVPDLDMYTLHVLSDGRILVFRAQHIEVWDSRFQRMTLLSIGPGYNRTWTVSADEQSLILAQPMQVVQVWNLITGEQTERYESTIARPEQLPSQELLHYQPAAGGYVWRGWGGPYLHTGDGPRGWVTPLTVSGNGSETVIPCKSAAAHMALEPTSRLLTWIPFQGRMRAGCIVDKQMLVVNSAGKLFTSPPLNQ